MVDAIDGTGGDLVVSFASVGHDPDRPPSPEFVASATSGGRAALFVRDESRSWGQTPGLDAVLALALARMPPAPAPRRLACIGHSMGAVLALRTSASLGAAAVIALGPQSRLGPPETRWARWTAPLAPLPPLRPGPGDWWIVMHGLADDSAQAEGFAPAPGLDHILFPGLGHSALSARLKERGALAGLIEAALDRDRRRLLRILASCGGRLRSRLPQPGAERPAQLPR